MLNQFPRTYFLLIIILLLSNRILIGQSINFNHITVEDGLSNNDVNTLMQDRFGFIWFGTNDGLNRYDGYNFKIFHHDPNDSNSISDNNIWALFEDRQGNILIGTKSGILNIFDPELENFKHKEIYSNRTQENSITAICDDREGNIWLGTRRDGIYRLNIQTDKLDHWNKDTNGTNGLSFFSVRSIIEDENGDILIGTYSGFNKFNTKYPERGFTQYYSDDNNPKSLSDNQIYNISKSSTKPNIFWIGTPKGLTKYDNEKNSFLRIKIPNPDNHQFGSGASTVIEDKVDGENIIWTDTYGGLVRLNLTSGDVIRFVNNENNNQSIISNQINKIIKDRSGVLWIATENGVSYYTEKSTKFNSALNPKYRFFLNSIGKEKNLKSIVKNEKGSIFFGFEDELLAIEKNANSLSLIDYSNFTEFSVWCLALGTDNLLWIGTFGQGLKTLDLNSGKISNWFNNQSEFSSGAALFTKSLLKDYENNIWVGFWGLAVARLIPSSKKYNLWVTNPKDTNSINVSDVWVIKQDRFGRIWIGTQGGGINLFEDKDSGIFHHWIQSNNELNSLSSNNIYSIYETKNLGKTDSLKTIIWVGTSNGLNKFTVTNKGILDIYDFDVKIESFTVKDGLPDNSVNSILEDENGNLWLGTGSGISFFDLNKKTFRNFTSADGINGMSMNTESALLLENGLALFGSTKGLNIFDPRKIKQSDVKPNIVFTDFQIFNKSVKIAEDTPLKESIITAKEIILTHDQNVFSIEFAALDYNSSKSIQYAYKMEGFDKDWIKSQTRRFVTYTNLNAGKYVFKVKATNADGIWNEDFNSIRIIMGQPWWKSIWAYLSYAVFIIIGLLGIRRFEKNRTKLRTELKLREIEADQKTELEKLKSRFFANLSHEFRTPLMLIKGPLEQLKLNGNNEKFSENIELIERNSNHLKILIDQLLELSQLEKAVIPVRAKRINIVPILKGLFSSFRSIAEEKNIELSFESSSNSAISWIDNDKFEKIINNLLSNAIKFTEANGIVKVNINEENVKGEPFVKIRISDNGISIPEEKLDRIFDRFYQVDDSTQRTHGGSGIGLALVKEFVDLHKWEISVKSEKWKGTEFTINIPLENDYLDENQKIKTEVLNDFDDQNAKENKELDTDLLIPEFTEHVPVDNSNNKISILIVDDSDDVRKYITDLLKDDYLIFEAQDGVQGVDIAKKIMPDLIISDVMMPSMDGFEFCRIIKSEWQTSDIPVILLTAKASFENKIEGLEIGADDYLTKPFESIELFARIKNLLEQRKRLVNKYGNNLDFRIKSNQISTADDDFIKRTIELVENNLDKTNFSTEHLAKELFVSRTKLHRKMIEITGQAPGEFVRLIKLKHAAKLITEKRLSITQIAFEIGFSSPAQFTRAFNKQFNCLPSEYLTDKK